MQLKKALDDKKLDVRLRDRLTAEGKLTKKELDESQKKLQKEESDFVESKIELGSSN